MIKILWQKLFNKQESFIEKLIGRLTPEQKKHFVTIEWLINFEENMRMGRTYLLSIAFVKRAIKYPDRWIGVFDHNPGMEAKKTLLAWIAAILKEDEGLFERTEFKQNNFRIRKFKYKYRMKEYRL